MPKLGNRTIEKDGARLRVLMGNASTPAGITDHGSLAGLGDDDHAQYLHLSAARTITAQHTISPASPQAPFLLGGNAQGQLVTGLNADYLDGQHAIEFALSSHTQSLSTITAPTGNVSWNMVDNHFQLLWVQPVTGGGISGALEIEASGAFTGDLIHVHQHTGNPGAGADLLHLEATDTDVLPLRILGTGTYSIQADKAILGRTLVSNVATGTAPLGVSSTTLVTNLNADKADGYDFNQAVQTTSSPTFVGLTLTGLPTSLATDTYYRILQIKAANEIAKSPFQAVYALRANTGFGASSPSSSFYGLQINPNTSGSVGAFIRSGATQAGALNFSEGWLGWEYNNNYASAFKIYVSKTGNVAATPIESVLAMTIRANSGNTYAETYINGIFAADQIDGAYLSPGYPYSSSYHVTGNVLMGARKRHTVTYDGNWPNYVNQGDRPFDNLTAWGIAGTAGVNCQIEIVLSASHIVSEGLLTIFFQYPNHATDYTVERYAGTTWYTDVSVTGNTLTNTAHKLTQRSSVTRYRFTFYNASVAPAVAELELMLRRIYGINDTNFVPLGSESVIPIYAPNLYLYTAPATPAFQFTMTNGSAIFNASNAAAGDLQVKGQTENNLLYTDASADAIGIGTNAPSGVRMAIVRSSNQLRLGYDGSNYADFSVTSGGNLSIAPTGDLVLNPTGNDILPAAGYDLNLGSLALKYLTLHAAELWVETLVAASTIATIGGRILVGPTTTLTADLAAGDASMSVKHNQLAAGDVVYLEANGAVEFISITGGPTGIGPYSYTITRNLDGSGANQWYAGDAVFNTGAADDGFIDLYSVRGVKSGSEAGPAIVGNVRLSGTFNDWSPRWAIGNLNGLYGVSGDTYGVAFGDSSNVYLRIDASIGLRIYDGATILGEWQTDGDIFVGDQAGEHVAITPTAVQMKIGATVYTELTTTALTLGEAAGEHVAITPTAVQMKIGATVYTELTASSLILGDDATGEYLAITGTAVELYGGGAKLAEITGTAITMYDTGGADRLVLNTGGVIVGDQTEGEYVSIASAGLKFYANATQRGEFTGATGAFWFGAGATTERLSFDTTNGLQIYNHSNAAVVKLPTSGDGEIVGTLSITGIGVIKIGNDVKIDTDGIRISGGINDVNLIKFLYDGADRLTMGLEDLDSEGGFYVKAKGDSASTFGTIFLRSYSSVGGLGDRIEVGPKADASAGGILLATQSLNIVLRGQTVIDNYPLYVEGGMVVGTGVTAVADDIMVPQGGMWLGREANPGAGQIGYTGNLTPYRGSTEYTGYVFVPLSTQLTSTSWDGDTFSDVASSTAINLNTVFGVPKYARAVLVQIVARDSVALGTDGLYIAVGPTSGFWYALACRPPGGDVQVEVTAPVPTSLDGSNNPTLYYRINASGASTMDVWIRINGYWI